MKSEKTIFFHAALCFLGPPLAWAQLSPNPLSSTCTDTAPSSDFTCQEQASFGKCSEPWMSSCVLSCGRCVRGECETISEFILSREDLTLFARMLDGANLMQVLNSPDTLLTVLAPNNAGVQALLQDRGLSFEDVLADQRQLGLLLNHHLLTDVKTYATITDDVTFPTLLAFNNPGYYSGSILQLGPGSTSVTFFRDRVSPGSITVQSNGDTSTVVVADSFACSSVVHVIDGVLIPEASTEI